jgi:hypothetical protein
MWQRFCCLLHWLTCPDTRLTRDVEKMLLKLVRSMPPFCLHKFQSYRWICAHRRRYCAKQMNPAPSHDSTQNHFPSLDLVITLLCTCVKTTPHQAYRKGASLHVRLLFKSKRTEEITIVLWLRHTLSRWRKRRMY